MVSVNVILNAAVSAEYFYDLYLSSVKCFHFRDAFCFDFLPLKCALKGFPVI